MPIDKLDDVAGVITAMVNSLILVAVEFASIDKADALAVLEAVETRVEAETAFRLRSDYDRLMVLSAFDAAREQIDRSFPE